MRKERAFALGRMHLSLNDFLELLPVEYLDAKIEFIKAENEKYQDGWERARWQVFRSICPPTGKKLRITDFIQFAWEQVKQKAKANPQRAKAVIEKWG